jgi:hypothetical protein
MHKVGARWALVAGMLLAGCFSSQVRAQSRRAATVIVLADSVVRAAARVDSTLATLGVHRPPPLAQGIVRLLCRMHTGGEPHGRARRIRLRVSTIGIGAESTTVLAFGAWCGPSQQPARGYVERITVFGFTSTHAIAADSALRLTVGLESQIVAQQYDGDQATWVWTAQTGWQRTAYSRGVLDGTAPVHIRLVPSPMARPSASP